MHKFFLCEVTHLQGNNNQETMRLPPGISDHHIAKIIHSNYLLNILFIVTDTEVYISIKSPELNCSSIISPVTL